MRTDDIIALAIFTTAGVAAYLLYTKQIEWPFGDIPNPFEETKSDDKEEQDVVKDIAGETDFSAKDFIDNAFKKGQDILGRPKSNFNPKDIIGNAFARGEDILKAPANFLSDALKRGQDILKPKSIVSIPTTKSDKSLDDMIDDALRGQPFRPYSGTKYKPYS